MSLSHHTAELLGRKRRLFSVDDYERMGGAGVLRLEERTELIEGEVIDVGSRYSYVITCLINALHAAAPGKYLVSSQIPLQLGDRNVPEPDVVVLKPGTANPQHHPRAGDVCLLVEVCDSSMEFDLGVKLPIYARYNVPEVWLVDLRASTVHVCRQPGSGGYGNVRQFGRGEAIALSFADGQNINTADFLPE